VVEAAELRVLRLPGGGYSMVTGPRGEVGGGGSPAVVAVRQAVEVRLRGSAAGGPGQDN
jgi:hypothetical protein